VNSSGRPWLGGGPTALEEKGGGEGQLHFWGTRAQAVLPVEGGWRRCLGEIPVKVTTPVVHGMNKWCWGTEEEEVMVCLGMDERARRRVVA
jgi:hypothetical protein